MEELEMTNYLELLEKDIINIKNGEVIGRFDDVEIDAKTGKITAFYIEEGGRFLGILGKSKTRKIRWEDIIRIGVDVIIVNADDDNRAIKEMLE
jgi:YlmC/YmxH family sporulation protein